MQCDDKSLNAILELIIRVSLFQQPRPFHQPITPKA
ncbi:hypothetical protein PNK_0571 [Candidatus Protochlamydia naegleriophila]|uniref:Uncharacterized protein n=1 Tax=Candidatus Protochlamydia naegleriophila TaxID=389348 RepID=A0A0U5JAR7_9BACT|nr:hypothetical protein PNK_0571 [Candidatus Protochlamydia naegleriophila]